MELDNTKIRRMILGEHESLRMRLKSIDQLLEQVIAGDAKAQNAAHEQVSDLLSAFIRHIEHEERVLLPVLKGIDAWGPARAQSMNDEHAEQRRVVTRLAAMAPAESPKEWAKEIRAFTHDLLLDMANEEKSSLSANVLRDDIIAVEGSSE